MKFLDGIAISGYRSFGEQIQLIGPFDRINIIIGKNNSGKSNILTFIHDQLPKFIDATKRGSDITLTDFDLHIGLDSRKITFGVAVDESSESWRLIRNQLTPNYKSDPTRWDTQLLEILRSTPMIPHAGLSWFLYERRDNRLRLRQKLLDGLKSYTWQQVNSWPALLQIVANKEGGSRDNQLIDILSKLSPATYLDLSVDLMPAVREISSEDPGERHKHGGVGLIDELARLQNPNLQNRADKNRFDRINRFLKAVLENSSAQLEVPHDRDTIVVVMDGKELPLSSVGSGVHEVIILAAKSTVFEGQIVCIEEPELHLHPILQRKLISYLYENTTNQYFITTHSSHFMDTVPCKIFHVQSDNGQSVVRLAETDIEKSHICADLGYRATDLLQANAVIWVEGPTDRLYINHWLRKLDPRLTEGINYSVMFYGGRLLAHVSGSDEFVSEFISLRRLNRFSAVIMDSDRREKGSRVSATKLRIKREFELEPGLTWITMGREIENYVDADTMIAAIKAIMPTAWSLLSSSQYARIYEFRLKSRQIVRDIDKVSLAHEVVKHEPNFQVFDLLSQTKRLANFIRKANGLSDM